MSEYKRILAAVDFSPVSAGALVAARDISVKLGACIRVVHVVPVQAAALPLEGGAVYVESTTGDQVEAARLDLSRFLETHAPGATLDTEVRPGEPAAEINQAARDWKADMIVLGTHGRSGISHLLMGSVAERVLRESTVPVLCVRG